MIKVIMSGNYDTPHLIIQIGNKKTAAHTEQYANRSNARRAQKTWALVLAHQGHGLRSVEMIDETVKDN